MELSWLHLTNRISGILLAVMLLMLPVYMNVEASSGTGSTVFSFTLEENAQDPVTDNEKSSMVKTGDATDSGKWAILSVASGVFLTLSVMIHRQEKQM